MWLPVLAGACLLALLGPQMAEAEISCRYDSGKMTLAVTASGFEGMGIKRFRDEILVSSFSGPPILCRGEQATVTNTEHVTVVVRDRGSGSIELAGGDFAPGATEEADGASEIEFTVKGHGFVDVEGGPGRDHFRYMGFGRESGVNLNPDEDEDVDLVSSSGSGNPLAFLLVVEGGAGADLIDAQNRLDLEMFAEGGDGNDTLVAPRSGGAILDGDDGRDRLFGGQGEDLISPGAGADLVKTLAGADEVWMRPDRRRDRVDCGPGPDFAGRHDNRDRLSSCEFPKRRR